MFIVTEIQNGTATPYVFTDKATAFEKFFQIAVYIPKSTVDIHTVTIQDAYGMNIYTPITKESVA